MMVCFLFDLDVCECVGLFVWRQVNASLAQSVEHAISNGKVAGSKPARGKPFACFFF